MKTKTKFKRIEKKYILTIQQKEALIKTLSDYITPDKNWKKWNYQLESLYYDTKDLKFFQEKINWKPFRKKIRIRRYIDSSLFSDNSPVFIEIKEKIGETTVKRRIKMSYKEAKNLIENRIIPNHTEEDVPMIKEILSMNKNENLYPQTITSYDREAFFWVEKEYWLRLTFDTEVFFQSNTLNLANNKDKDWRLADKGKTILEIKVNEKYPEYITRFLEENNLQPDKMSKYAEAINLINK